MNPKNTDIFISYSHDDKVIVSPIAEKLKSAGFRVWIDERLSAGDQYRDDIDSAIEQCRLFLLMCSRKSVESKWVKREACFADELGKQIIPVLLEQVNYPKGLRATLASTQRLDLFDKDEAKWWALVEGVVRNAGIQAVRDSKYYLDEERRKGEEGERLRQETQKLLAAAKERNEKKEAAEKERRQIEEVGRKSRPVLETFNLKSPDTPELRPQADDTSGPAKYIKKDRSHDTERKSNTHVSVERNVKDRDGHQSPKREYGQVGETVPVKEFPGGKKRLALATAAGIIIICISAILIVPGLMKGGDKNVKQDEKVIEESGRELGKASSIINDGRKLIGVSLQKENDDFSITLKKGLMESAEASEYDIEILSADNDELKQDRNVDALLLKNIDTLVICPVNSKGVGPIISKATDKGIPVFTVDNSAGNGKVVAHIASDNRQGGQIAAERMAKLLGGKGSIAIIQYPGTKSIEKRVGGFSYKANELGLTVLKPYLNGKDDTLESERAAKAAINNWKGLKGIFAANDNMAMGAEQAIISSGRDIILIGYDAAPAARQRIARDGVWKADVIQYPYEIGKITIKTIDQYFKGMLKLNDYTANIPVKVGLVDASSLKN